MAVRALDDILVVDDDPTIVDLVIEALGAAGYSYCVAYDGESALMAIETAQPALVLLDIHLPGLTGIAVVAQLRRTGLTHVPIVPMTADAAAAALLSSPTFPIHLLKPFSPDHLLGCIAEVVPRPL